MKNTKYVFINDLNKKGNENRYVISKTKRLSSGAFLAEIKSCLEGLWHQGQFKESLNLQRVINELTKGCFRTDIQFLTLLYSAATNSTALVCYDKQLSRLLSGIELKTRTPLPTGCDRLLEQDIALLCELVNELGDRLNLNFCCGEVKQLSGIQNFIETLSHRLVTLNEQSNRLCSCLV